MAQYVLDENRGPSGVPPGWYVLEIEGEYVVVNAEETHAVQFVHDMLQIEGGGCFALFERKIECTAYGFGYVERLEFDLRGWTTAFEGGEQWLRGEHPDLFIRDNFKAEPVRK